MENTNVVEVSVTILAWCVIAWIAYRLYNRQADKPKIWKVLVVMLVGLFSFLINIEIFGMLMRISILPLGVWILYAYFRKKNEEWQIYRPFAWLGFVANFIILAFALLAVPIFQFMYPSEPSTFLSNINDASIIPIHPGVRPQEMDKENALATLLDFSEEPIHSEVWYREADLEADSTNTQEKFPYQLIGVIPKWGSGLISVVYIEEDGKGLLISTPKEQHYFRFKHSLIEGVN
ncbi:hypothetical protein M9R32_07955 [Paenisporosarcina quisquiliarum]|uniref:Uncharacterized protein n=1 Tax=Paenisporosarcina quisquiliarum TaxID=365346 RepID=A0A9X3RE82_9BACL|nr:hypothetical protein [Paenisporosarcina quisquiliarum]MCZ8537108.1 hypothetical protein [Paenisporosarcina quisquiliarum]